MVSRFPPEFGNEDDLIRRGDVMKPNMLQYITAVKTTGEFCADSHFVNLKFILEAPAVVKGEDFKNMISNHLKTI